MELLGEAMAGQERRLVVQEDHVAPSQLEETPSKLGAGLELVAMMRVVERLESAVVVEHESLAPRGHRQRPPRRRRQG
jgi:hypothetical protein